MNKSEQIKTLTTALLKAQAEMKAIVKDAENPFFKSDYATLANVIDEVKMPLNDNGIVILQPVMNDIVETTLLHAESGEWISSETKIITAKPNDPQAQGSAITYARRYGLMSLLALPVEDDDGEGATEHKPTGFQKPKQEILHTEQEEPEWVKPKPEYKAPSTSLVCPVDSGIDHSKLPVVTSKKGTHYWTCKVCKNYGYVD